MGKLVRALAALAFAAVFLPGAAFAQTAATGSIEGVVTDATGGVLPGVTVVVKNSETNLSRDLITDGGGRYRATALQPGTYEVSATLAGFTATPLKAISVQVGQTQPVDIRMRPAGVAESVTVTGEAPLVDTRRTDVSNVIGEKAIENLPINGRRWENFVLLSPGVTNDGGFGLVSYRGISGLYNNNTVDGADNNQAFFSEARGRTRTSYSISQAAIKEFQVGISNFSAEFGRAAGGSVNAVTKSGTNTNRGEAFYFLRDDKFMAMDPFAHATGQTKPGERRQQFGASAGGPIKQDKIFYFVNYDGQRRDFPYFVNFPATFTTAACTAPGCASTIALYTGLNAFFPRQGTNDVAFGKIDVSLSQKHNLTVQYNMHRWDSPNGVQTAPVVSVSPTANGKDVVKTDFLVATLNSVLSQKWLNEARVQIGRDSESQLPNAPGPSTTVTNGPSFGMPNFLPRSKYPDERRLQLIDNVSRYAGAHNLKTGIDLNFVQENLINLFQGGGTYAYTSLNNIASDCPYLATGCSPLIAGAATDLRHYSTFTQAFDLRGGDFQGDVKFSTVDYNWFAQDNWRVGNQLTLNLGLRYEYQQLPQPGKASVRGVTMNGNPNYPATMTFHQDKNNWGPRLGFTYDIGGTHQTVVRGGWGIYYGRTSNSQVSSALTNNAVTLATYVFTPTSPGAPQYPNVPSAPPTQAGSVPTINFFSPGLERPQIYQAEMTVDRAVGADMTISASYLYSRGTHLPLFTDTNLPAASSQVVYMYNGQNVGTYPFYRGTRPDTRIGAGIELLDSVKSRYNALVLQANKRFSHGWLLNANYTLSKSEDSGQNSTTFFGSFANLYDPNNPQFEFGTSDFDRRHRLIVSTVYAPGYLYGVQLGLIGTFESGLPITGSISGSVSGTGAVSTATSNGSGASNRAPFDERNSFRQQGRKTIDLRASKVFKVGGAKQVEVLWEAFNLFNIVNYTGYSSTKYSIPTGGATYNAATNIVTVNLVDSTSFGTPSAASNTLFGPRDMQFGLKFKW